MTRDDITKGQAKQIAAALFPPVNYVARLRRRMEQRGFPHADPLYLSVCAAHEAMNRLRLEVHYLACDGAGRAADRSRPPA
jgi:hypothetical protein